MSNQPCWTCISNMQAHYRCSCGTVITQVVKSEGNSFGDQLVVIKVNQSEYSFLNHEGHHESLLSLIKQAKRQHFGKG